VIKGPAAATLYGAEAANGVIQIITKKGTAGAQDLQWDARFQGGRTSWAVDRVRNYTTCTPALMALKFSGGNPQFPGCQGNAGKVLSATSLDSPGALRDGDVRNFGLSLRGGGIGYSYFSDIFRDQEEGVFLNSGNDRTSARANFAFYPNAHIDYNVNLGYTHTTTQFPINDDGYGLFQAAVLYRPGFDVTGGAADRTDGFDGGNGPDRIYEWDNQLRADRATLGTTVNFHPVPWLKNRLTVGIDQNTRLAEKYLPPNSIWGGAQGQSQRGAPSTSIISLDYAGTVEREIAFGLSSATSIGTQYTYSRFRNIVGTGFGFASGTLRDLSLAAQTTSYPENSDQKSLGVYAQEQVGWKDRLFVTAALRVDNNSVFGDNIKQLYYPKLSAAWVISEEPFFQRYSWFDQLKLRAAWGQAGNAPSPFAGQRNYTSGPTIDDHGNLVPALRTNAYGNPDIKPERGSEIEVGADATLFKDRLGIELTYYDKTTRDAIMQVPVPASSGFVGNVLQNLGEINNKGMELALTATPVDSRLLSWTARAGFSTNSNKLVSFGDARPPIQLSLYIPVQRHQAGYPLGGYWGNFPKRDAAGQLVRDASTGGLVADSQVFIGPSTPRRELSFANTFTVLRNLRLFALIDYKGGHYLYNVKDQYRCWGQPLATSWNTDPSANIPGQCAEVNDPGKSEEFKEVRQQDISVNNGLFIQKADFIKLRDVSMTYTLPAPWAHRVGTDRMALTLAAHNVGFLWKPHYTGPDPEVNFTGVNDPGSQFAYIRVDSWTAPMTRRLTAALDLRF
jgi:TonB-dependent starch-binding outer membrane protein SusC